METLVIFLMHDGNEDLFALFPQIEADNSGNKQSYSHEGQHSAVSKDYLKECRLAKEYEYKYLLIELTEQVEYDLVVVNELTPLMAEETGLKTLYYTVEKEMVDLGDGYEGTDGFKNIRLYDIVNNRPVLLTEIHAENQYSSVDELTHWVSITAPELVDEGETIPLNLDLTFTFEEL